MESIFDDLIDLPSAAQYTGFSGNALLVRIRHGHLPARQIGRRWFIHRDHVEAIAAERRRGPFARAYPVLTALADHDGATVEELARIVGRPKRTVLGWLKDLDLAGLVERRRSNDPRSPASCSLTESGWDFYRKEGAEEATRNKP
jgi:hypothetical protein